jgi:hypothetical protein
MDADLDDELIWKESDGGKYTTNTVNRSAKFGGEVLEFDLVSSEDGLRGCEDQLLRRKSMGARQKKLLDLRLGWNTTPKFLVDNGLQRLNHRICGAVEELGQFAWLQKSSYPVAIFRGVCTLS